VPTLGFYSFAPLESKEQDMNSMARELRKKCKKWKTQNFIEHADHDVIVHNTKENEPYPGDIAVWKNNLYDEHDKELRGSSIGFCFFLPELIYQCSIALELNGGQIMLQGTFEDNPWKMAIVGGTGCHEGRKGEVEITTPYKGDGHRTHFRVDFD